MKRTFLLASVLLFAPSLFSQKADDFKKKFETAEKLFEEGNYAEAQPLFVNLYLQKTDDALVCFKAGVCYLNSVKEKKYAIEFLEKALLNIAKDSKETSWKEQRAPVIAYKYLADAYHLFYKFDNAIINYQKFEEFVADNDTRMHEEIKRKVENCRNGKALAGNPVDAVITDLGPSVNSPDADFSPVISADEKVLIFTSRRDGSTGNKKDEDGKNFEDIYICTKKDSGWSEAKNIGAPINTEGHEATVGISVDGQQIIIYKDDKTGHGDLYLTSLKGDAWSEPVKLPDPINTQYWEPHATFSADGNTIYFSSDRPGGFGGRDIYRVTKLPNGQWSKAMNLGPDINTTYDEDAPVLHPDGKRLYFSSTGFRSMGGFDIFMSTMTDSNKWSPPQNIGYPINTTDDDIFFVPTPDGKHAYFSSYREDGLGEKDIYRITFPEAKEALLALVSGTVLDPYGKVPDGVKITVTDNATGEVVGTYTPNSKSGRYVFILPPGKNYNIAYEAEDYLFKSDNVDISDNCCYARIERAVVLDPIVVGSKTVLNNIFFDFDKATLKTESNVELEKLSKLLSTHPGLKVEISGHTDSKGDDEYNMRLSQKRAEAIVTWLNDKGIEKTRMSAKGYGETVPVEPNTLPNGKDNPQGRAKNRRVELKILEK